MHGGLEVPELSTFHCSCFLDSLPSIPIQNIANSKMNYIARSIYIYRDAHIHTCIHPRSQLRGPDFLISISPELQTSETSDLQNSRFPELQISRPPDFQNSRFPELQISRNLQSSKSGELQNSRTPDLQRTISGELQNSSCAELQIGEPVKWGIS